MLKLNKMFCLRSFCVFLFVSMCGTQLWGYGVKQASTKIRNAWGATSKNGATVAGGGNFVLEGGIGKVRKGTYEDEYALMGVVALQIVEHGGYFCPMQIQCINERRRDWSDMHLYFPKGFSRGKCLWLCENGYTGVNCAKQVAVTPALVSPIDQVFSGVSMIEGKDIRSGDDGYSVTAFHAWTNQYDRDRMILLGLTDFVEHGGLALPIYLSCTEEGYKDNVSYIDSMNVYPNVTPKLLCAEGYTANSTNTACVELTADALELQQVVGESNKTFCADWDESKYQSTIHEIDLSGTCIRFLCRDRTRAFPARGDYTCAECAGSIRGGQHSKTGLCVKCEQPGMFFNQETNVCDFGNAYTVLELLYGVSKKRSTNVIEECWTKVDPLEYRECVTGKKVVQETE